MIEKNKEKGITLVVLVVTVIILAILVGISITGLRNSKTIVKAETSKIREMLVEIEDEANLIYTNKIEKMSITDTDALMADTVEELKGRGYDIYAHSIGGKGKITLDKSQISMFKNETSQVTMNFEDVEVNQYYAVVNNKYYLLSYSTNRIDVAREATDISALPNNATVDTSGFEIAATSDNTCVTVGNINQETREITLNSASEEGEARITVTYGGYSVSCRASVETEMLIVTYKANGGKFSDGETIAQVKRKKGSTINSFVESPEQDEKYFKGWYTETSGGTAVTESTVVEDNMTLYACWASKY